MKKIYQISPWIDIEERKQLNKVIDNNFLTENKFTSQFEKSFQNLLNNKNLISINNWTSGLFCALKALDIKSTDEIIVPNITFIATANAVLMCGAKVVLCEVNEIDGCINLEKAEKLINKNTKAIIPVHLYGNCADMDKALYLKRKYNISIIEDAAQAILSKFKEKYLGTIGDFGGFSLYGNKLITTGEGGIVISKVKKNIEKIKLLKNHGRKTKGTFKHEEIGFNFCLTEMQAAIGISQLKKIKKIVKKKEFIFHYYKKKLKPLPQIDFLNHVNEIKKPVFWFTTIKCKNSRKLSKYLETKNIQTRKLFYPLNQQPCYKQHKEILNKKFDFKVSKSLYNNALSLPSSYNLSISELDYICKCIKSFYENRH